MRAGLPVCFLSSSTRMVAWVCTASTSFDLPMPRSRSCLRAKRRLLCQRRPLLPTNPVRVCSGRVRNHYYYHQHYFQQQQQRLLKIKMKNENENFAPTRGLHEHLKKFLFDISGKTMGVMINVLTPWFVRVVQDIGVNIQSLVEIEDILNMF